MSYLGIGVSPGDDVPVHHGSNLKKIDKRVRIVELILRCVIFGLSIVGAILIASDSQVKVIFTIKKEAKFTDMKVLVFLVIANGLAAAYSLIQVLMAYLILAAAAAAAQSGVISKVGQPELQWMKVCNLYGKFCNQVGEGIASSLIVSLSMIVVSSISAFGLFRLYGRKNNAR